MKNIFCISLFSIAIFLNSDCQAQIKLDNKLKKKIIDELIKTIREEYIMEENISVITAFLEQQLKNKAYDTLNDPKEFSRVVSRDLRSISHDKHMGFGYHPEQMNNIDPYKNNNDREGEMKSENYGFIKAEHFPVNISYVKFNHFWELKYTKPTIDAAMNFISNSKAVILDLRENGGGDPETVAYICSYFTDKKNLLINTIKERKNSVLTEWKVREVGGKQMINQPLYILTSDYTFSGAEEFAYDMQGLKRGTVVGEITGGGAHPVNDFPLSNGFVAHIPYAKAINPYTHSNWEGTGVIPDIKCKREDALIIALKNIMDNTADTAEKKQLSIYIKVKKAEINPVYLENKILESYAGSYGIRTITFANHTLFIQREGGPKFKLIPLSETEFNYEGTEGIVRFNAALKEIEITMNDGSIVKALKN